jgi:hypothetical protein
MVFIQSLEVVLKALNVKIFPIGISFYLLLLQLFSQNINKERFDLGISFVTVFPGEIEAAYYSDLKPEETFSLKNKVALLKADKVDYCFSRYLSSGICNNYAPIRVQDNFNIGLNHINI